MFVENIARDTFLLFDALFVLDFYIYLVKEYYLFLIPNSLIPCLFLKEPFANRTTELTLAFQKEVADVRVGFNSFLDFVNLH